MEFNFQWGGDQGLMRVTECLEWKPLCTHGRNASSMRAELRPPFLKNSKYNFENKQVPIFLGVERIGHTGIYKTRAP